MTSNRPLEDWGKLLGDVPSATAILDRFLHHAEIDADHREELSVLAAAGRPEGEAGGESKPATALSTGSEGEGVAVKDRPCCPTGSEEEESRESKPAESGSTGSEEEEAPEQ